MKKIKKNQKLRSPIVVILIMIALILVISCIASLLGLEGQKTSIVNGDLETSIVTVRNPLSTKGITSILSNGVVNFAGFEAIIYFLISVISLGILDKSGILDVILKPFKNFKTSIIVFFTLLFGIIFSFFGEYAYALLLPLTAIVYKKLGKNPILGIMVCFIAITVGYGAGVVINYDDYSLGMLTETSAKLDVDKEYKFNLNSNLIVMIVSTIILSIMGSILSHKFLEFKIPTSNEDSNDEIVISKKGIITCLIVFIISILIIVYLILPISLPCAGLLLSNGKIYINRLLGMSSPFKNSFLILITILCSLCGAVYGFISKKFKNSYDYGEAISETLSSYGTVIVYAFFVSQLLYILSWTNLGEVVACCLVNFMSSLQFSGMPLIIMFFIITILISILVPDTITKWTLISPTIVPLFMRANITPDFTQFIFKAADGAGKCMTPFYAYFMIMLALLNCYKNKDTKITLFGTLKTMLPVILLLTGVWILILIGWYIIGIPLGMGTYTTL